MDFKGTSLLILATVKYDLLIDMNVDDKKETPSKGCLRKAIKNQ